MEPPIVVSKDMWFFDPYCIPTCTLSLSLSLSLCLSFFPFFFFISFLLSFLLVFFLSFFISFFLSLLCAFFVSKIAAEIVRVYPRNYRFQTAQYWLYIPVICTHTYIYNMYYMIWYEMIWYMISYDMIYIYMIYDLWSMIYDMTPQDSPWPIRSQPACVTKYMHIHMYTIVY